MSCAFSLRECFHRIKQVNQLGQRKTEIFGKIGIEFELILFRMKTSDLNAIRLTQTEISREQQEISEKLKYLENELRTKPNAGKYKKEFSEILEKGRVLSDKILAAIDQLVSKTKDL
jgi:hypothetical protein